MKSVMRYLFISFVFVANLLANPYGLSPCPDGSDNCPPGLDGRAMGNFRKEIIFNGNAIKWQTNIDKIPYKNAYSSFKTKPTFEKQIHGDYTVAGNTIMKYKNNSLNIRNSLDSYYLNDDWTVSRLNSSTATMYFPKDMKPEYIKYARIHWVGNINSMKLDQTKDAVFPKFKCLKENDKLVKKSYKKQLDANYLLNECLKTGNSSLRCSSIAGNIVGNRYFVDNDWFDFGKYSYPVGSSGKPEFYCSVSENKMMKASEKRLIDDRVIGECNSKYGKSECKNIFGSFGSGYYEDEDHVNKSKDIAFICQNPSQIAIKFNELSSLKQNQNYINECKKIYGANNSQCDNILKSDYYKQSPNKFTYIFDSFAKKSISGNTRYCKNKHYTIDDIKNICKKDNDEAACNILTKNLLKTKGLDIDNMYVGFSSEIEAKNWGCTDVQWAIAKGSVTDFTTNRRDGYKPVFQIQSIIIKAIEDKTCIEHPDKCAKVTSCEDIDFSGGNFSLDTYCKLKPNKCEKVNICKKYEIIKKFDEKYCKTNPNDCVNIKTCDLNVETVVGKIGSDFKTDSDLADITEYFLSGYRSMNLKVGNNKKTFTSLDKDTFYVLSINNERRDGGLIFQYSASADATEFVKEALKDKYGNIVPTEVTIAAGDIKSTVGHSYNRHSRKCEANGQQDDCVVNRIANEYLLGATIDNFGTWMLNVVYDKDDATDSDKEFYRPKFVTIYNGFAIMSDSIQLKQGTNIDFNFGGFYTPTTSNYDAKSTIYAISPANYTENKDNALKVLNINNNKMESIFNEVSQKYQFSGGISVVKPGKANVDVIDRNPGNQISINSFVLNSKDGRARQKFMKDRQTDIKFQYGIKATGSGGTNYTEYTFPSVFNFSTDIYMPEVCYDVTVYNSVGESSRGEGFTVAQNEILTNHVIFRLSDKSASNESEGVVVKADLSGGYVSYQPNTARIDNSLKEKNFVNDKLLYVNDNETGLYKTIQDRDGRKNKITDKQLITVNGGKSIDFYIGENAGIKNGNSISGGVLKKGQNVFVEYKTKIDGYYEEPKFRFFFSKNGVVQFKDGLPVPKCPLKGGGEFVNIVKVVPIEGIKVVNENYGNGYKGDNLYTQVANEPFNLKIAYEADLSNQNNEDLSKILGDDELSKLVCKNSNLSKQECIKNFKEKRSHFFEDIKKLKIDIETLKKEINNLKNELDKKLKNLPNCDINCENKIKNNYSKLIKEASKDPSKLNDPAFKSELDKAIEDFNKIGSNQRDITSLKTKIKKLEDELNEKNIKLKNVLSELDNLEKNVKGEYSKRLSKINGVFVVALTTEKDKNVIREAINKDNKTIIRNDDPLICRKIMKNINRNDVKKAGDNQYKFFMDFNKNVIEESVKDIKGNILLSYKYEPNKSKDINRPYSWFEIYKKSAGEINMNNLQIGLARKDYTFAVRYVQAGFANTIACLDGANTTSDKKQCLKDNDIRIVDKNGKEYKLNEQNDEEVFKRLLEQFYNEVVKDSCVTDEFSIRPAYFAFKDSQDNKIRDKSYIAGDKELNKDFISTIYPSDKNGNYVLGYDSVLMPSTNNKSGSTIFSQISTEDCLNEEPYNIFYNKDNKKIVYANEKSNNFIKLWERDKNSSNNLKVDFNNKKNIDDEIRFYNEQNEIEKNEAPKKYGKYEKKQYAKVSLDSIGDLNYFNIGYAKMSFSDFTWTNEDQNEMYIGCLDNNYSYEHSNELNNLEKNKRVGCYIGIKKQNNNEFLKNKLGSEIINLHKIKDQDLVLKFKHDRVDINSTSFKDARVTSDHKGYTYFNNKYLSRMSANLDLNVTAYIAKPEGLLLGDIKDNIIATLYNNKCYSRDVLFGLDFKFNCADFNKSFTKYCNIKEKKEESKDLGKYAIDDNINNKKMFVDLSKAILFDNSNGMLKVNDTKTLKEVYNMESNAKSFVDENKSIFKFKNENFNNGSNTGTIFINFERSSKVYMPNNPKIILSKFIIDNNKTKKQELELKTDLKVKNNEISTDGIFADKGVKFINNLNSVATFYYGNFNAEQAEYGNTVVASKSTFVNIVPMIYCSDESMCEMFNLPLFKRNTNVNERFRKYFYQNQAIRPSLSIEVMDSLRKGYSENTNSVKIIPGNRIEKVNELYCEKLELKTTKKDTFDIDIDLKELPWFIYDDHNKKDAKYLYEYNMFIINFSGEKSIPKWGGVGNVNSSDVVGRFLDNDGNATKNSMDNLQNKGNRISW